MLESPFIKLVRNADHNFVKIHKLAGNGLEGKYTPDESKQKISELIESIYISVDGELSREEILRLANNEDFRDALKKLHGDVMRLDNTERYIKYYEDNLDPQSEEYSLDKETLSELYQKSAVLTQKIREHLNEMVWENGSIETFYVKKSEEE